MFCENCGTKLEKDNNFCENCGIETNNAFSKKELVVGTKKHTNKFTLIISGLLLLGLLGYWIYKFGIFTPERGTSVASSSALWGQFIVSFLSIIVFDAILIIADTRQQPTSIIKLVSFWFLIIFLGLVGYNYYHKTTSYGSTHTYKVGEEFNYLEYKFKINSVEIKEVPQEDCSKIVVKKGVINWCEYSNEANQNKKQAFIHLTVVNTNNTFEHFTPDWFTILSSKGKNYDLFSSNIPNELKSNSEVTGDLEVQYYLDDSESIYEIKIKIDNHAEQIINVET